MRRFASDVLTARDIALTFRSPESDLDWPVSADVRREVLLIFKETVNNVARHSGATEATIELVAVRGALNLDGERQRPGIRSGGDNVREMASPACGDGRSTWAATLNVRSTAAGTIVDLRAPGR